MLQNWSESAGNKVLLLFFAFTPNGGLRNHKKIQFSFYKKNPRSEYVDTGA